jgi:broad specificity phosphatase PhoE
MNIGEERIQSSDALVEMSQGHWEGCLRSEVYTPETLSLIDRLQPDFSAPSGESLRQVEFRMIQFLNGTVLGLPEKLRSDFPSNHQNESQGFSHHNSHALTNSIHDRDGPSLPQAQWDLHNRHRQGLLRKKSGKSRLQFVTTGDHEAEDEISPQDANHQRSLQDLGGRTSSCTSSCIGLFTHSVPIKCVLTGLLGCSPIMSHKICIEDSSVSVLQHSWKTGWQIKRLNDTAHLRLL